MVTGDGREEERKGVVIKSGWRVCAVRGWKKEFAVDGLVEVGSGESCRGTKKRGAEEEGGGKKAFWSIYSYFCAFLQLQHAFQFGDAAPVPPPNRSDNSLGSTENRWAARFLSPPLFILPLALSWRVEQVFLASISTFCLSLTSRSHASATQLFHSICPSWHYSFFFFFWPHRYLVCRSRS